MAKQKSDPTPNVPAPVSPRDLFVLDPVEVAAEVERTIPALSEDVWDAAERHARELDPFNVWKPQPGEQKVIRLLGAREAEVDGHAAIIVQAYDLRLRERVQFFAGDHLVSKFVENGAHKSGLPVSLTYRGKVRSKKRGTQVNDWGCYFFKEGELERLASSRKP